MHQYRVVVAGGCGSHGAVVLDNDDLRGDVDCFGRGRGGAAVGGGGILRGGVDCCANRSFHLFFDSPCLVNPKHCCQCVSVHFAIEQTVGKPMKHLDHRSSVYRCRIVETMSYRLPNNANYYTRE